MKKILIFIGILSIIVAGSSNVVACIPQNTGGDSPVGSGIDLSLFNYDKIIGNKKLTLSRKTVVLKDTVGNDTIDLAVSVNKLIQSGTSTLLDWKQVTTIAKYSILGTPNFNLQQVAIQMTAKSGATSFKNSVSWGTVSDIAPVYVDLRPPLSPWLNGMGDDFEFISVADPANQSQLEQAAVKIIFGTSFTGNDLLTTGLKGTSTTVDGQVLFTIVVENSIYFEAGTGELKFKVKKN